MALGAFLRRTPTYEAPERTAEEIRRDTILRRRKDDPVYLQLYIEEVATTDDERAQAVQDFLGERRNETSLLLEDFSSGAETIRRWAKFEDIEQTLHELLDRPSGVASMKVFALVVIFAKDPRMTSTLREHLIECAQHRDFISAPMAYMIAKTCAEGRESGCLTADEQAHFRRLLIASGHTRLAYDIRTGVR